MSRGRPRIRPGAGASSWPWPWGGRASEPRPRRRRTASSALRRAPTGRSRGPRERRERVRGGQTCGGYASCVLDQIREQLAALPRNPGVYLFRDEGDDVLYVGKAKSLRPRVRGYFNGGGGRPGNGRRGAGGGGNEG